MHKIRQFIAEVKGELEKVSWPSWVEVRTSTGVVMVTVIAVFVFLWVLTLVFSTITRFLFLG